MRLSPQMSQSFDNPFSILQQFNSKMTDQFLLNLRQDKVKIFGSG